MPKKGQMTVTLSGGSLKQILKAYKIAQRKMRKSHPFMNLKFASFVGEMTLLQCQKQGLLRRKKDK